MKLVQTSKHWLFSLFCICTDLDQRPFTDLYDTETGGFPGITFFARPVVGGHFSFLALERACGGLAVQALDFLNDEVPVEMDMKAFLYGGGDGEL